LGDVQSAILSPMDIMKKFLAPTTPASPPRDGASEVETLRQRVTELEARLHRPSPRKRQKRRS